MVSGDELYGSQLSVESVDGRNGDFTPANRAVKSLSVTVVIG